MHTPEAIDEVGCIHSIQGYDLNYAFVILGKDIGYDKNTKQIIIRKELYFDQNGKRSTTYEQLLEYIKNTILKKGYPPAVREICEAVRLKSTSSVHSSSGCT